MWLQQKSHSQANVKKKQKKSKSIKIPNVTSTRQTINYSTNIINIPFKGTTKIKIEEKKTFSFQTEPRALPRHHVLYKVLPQTWPISFQYTSIRTELNSTLGNVCSMNFESWILWVSCHSIFSFTISRFSIEMYRRHTQISQVMKGMEKKLSIKELWQCEKKYVFALCPNGIYVRMTLTGITICVLKNHWHFIKFFLPFFSMLYRHTYMFWVYGRL